MEERKKSPTEEAAYKAGMELLQRLNAEPTAGPEEGPSVAYVLPTTGHFTSKASLN